MMTSMIGDPKIAENARIKLFIDTMDGVVDESVLEWLLHNCFFRQVASSKFHGAYEGGLFDHSYAVMKNLVALTEKLDLKWERPESPKIVGMFHDLCKYDQYMKTVTGGYQFVRNTKIRGHGDKSVFLLKELMTVTDEESVCIEYHMGAFVDSKFWNAYGDAVERFPNVLWTHTADMMATHFDKV